MKSELINMTASVEQKKFESPTGIEPENQAGALSIELRELVESKVIYLISYVTGVLHIVRKSNVQVIVSVICCHITGCNVPTKSLKKTSLGV